MAIQCCCEFWIAQSLLIVDLVGPQTCKIRNPQQAFQLGKGATGRAGLPKMMAEVFLEKIMPKRINNYTPANKHSNGNSTICRCISYWKRWISSQLC